MLPFKIFHVQVDFRINFQLNFNSIIKLTFNSVLKLIFNPASKLTVNYVLKLTLNPDFKLSFNSIFKLIFKSSFDCCKLQFKNFNNLVGNIAGVRNLVQAAAEPRMSLSTIATEPTGYRLTRRPCPPWHLTSGNLNIWYFQQRLEIINDDQINKSVTDYDAGAFDDYPKIIKIVERWIYSTVWPGKPRSI